jgi:hypothetical protein
MKKLFSVILAFCVSTTLFSQKISTHNVPASVKEALKKTHPKATAKWEWEHKAYEANFKEAGREMSCIITSEGVLQETEMEMKLSELPRALQDYLAKNYRGKKISEISKFVRAHGSINYEVVMDGKELQFDANGNFTEQEEEKD